MTKRERILVLGLGRSGSAAARLLCRRGAEVVGYDRDPERSASVRELAAFVSGPLLPGFDGFDRVVQSPGIAVPTDSRIVPEVDLAAEHLVSPILGVTGTNGKSTTTTLLADMLAQSGLEVRAGGNLGTALCDLVGERAERVVAELSSFQLEHARSLSVDLAVLLNLAPDHLDRHGTVKAYGDAKARLVELQPPEGIVVYNREDPWAREAAERGPERRIPFSARRALAEGAFVAEDRLVVVEGTDTRLEVPLREIGTAALCPIDNALAAAAAALATGGTPEGIAAALARFPGLPHRGSLVCTHAGVRYVDDSKATNPAAALQSLGGHGGPVVWIAGGRNKGLDLTPLREAGSLVRVAIAHGEAGPEILDAVGGACPVILTDRLEDAFAAAAEQAREGDTVVLAPACASQDQFRSFVERGDRFAELARALSCSDAEASC